MEVIERFLFDGVDGQRTGFAIYLTDKHTVFVASASADACFAVRNLAMMWAELALYTSII